MSLQTIPPGNLSQRNKVFVGLFPWKVEELYKLPKHFQLALAEHTIWPRKVRKLVKENPQAAVLYYFGKRRKFGFAWVDSLCMRILVMSDPDRRRDFRSWNSYHRFFLRSAGKRVRSHTVQRKKMWPIILSPRGREKETIWDGWHRFHSYQRSGAKTVPILWYADE